MSKNTARKNPSNQKVTYNHLRSYNDISFEEIKNNLERYIELAETNESSNEEIAELYARICNEDNLSLYYIGYFARSFRNKLLCFASKMGHIELVRALLENDKSLIDFNTKDLKYFSLKIAIEHDQVEIIKLLQEFGMSTTIKDENQNVVFMALREALLLKFRATNSIHYLITQTTTKEMDDCLRDNDVLKNAEGEFRMLLMMRLGDGESFKNHCLDGDVEQVKEDIPVIFIDTHYNSRKTALFRAIEAGRYEVVKVLLGANASICISEADKTAIEVAFELYTRNDNYFNILKLLCAKEFQVELLDTDQDPKVILAKMVTTLLYKSKRYEWDSQECINLRKHCQTLANLYEIVLPDKLANYSKWLNEQDDYYGSYLSDDSDSDEEKLFLNDWDDKEDESLIRLGDKIIEREGKVYLDPADNPQSRQEKLRQIAIKRKEEASTIVESSLLKDIVNAMSDGKNHFKNNALMLTGATVSESTAEEKNKEAVAPVYKAGSPSQLLQRSKIPEIQQENPGEEFFASYRGEVYTTTSWNQSSRRYHRQRNDIGEAKYSAGVLFNASNLQKFVDLFAFEQSLTDGERAQYKKLQSKHSTLIKEKLIALKDTEKFYFETSKNKGYTFDNLMELFQYLYTNNYTLCTNYLIEEFFAARLTCKKNPLLSTAETPYHALKYGYGIKYYGEDDNTLSPNWKKNGRAERPHLGIVDISLHKSQDLKKANRVIELLFQGKIQVSNVIAAEREISHFAYIEEGQTVYRHMAKYPSFNKYRSIYLYKYGLDKVAYNAFKTFFNEHRKSPMLKNALGEYLSAFHEMRFVRIAAQEANKRNGRLVYLDHESKAKSEEIPLEYCSPNARMKSDSPLKNLADRAKQTLQKKAEKDSNASIIIRDKKSKRRKKFAKLILDIHKSDKADELPKELIEIKEKSIKDHIKTIKTIERLYTTLLHYAVLKCKMLAKEILNLIPSRYEVPIIDDNILDYEMVNLRDKYGNTPLHLAVLSRDDDLIEKLLDKGADPKIINNLGITAYTEKDESNDVDDLTSHLDRFKIARKLDFNKTNEK